MAKKEKYNNMTIIIIAVIAVVVVVALVIAFMGGNKGQNGSENVTSAEQTQTTDNNSKLAQVQSKIDAQEKVINDLNQKLTPLVEERSKLEEELMKLTNSGSTEPVTTPEEATTDESGVLPEETPEGAQETVVEGEPTE